MSDIEILISELMAAVNATLPLAIAILLFVMGRKIVTKLIADDNDSSAEFEEYEEDMEDINADWCAADEMDHRAIWEAHQDGEIDYDEAMELTNDRFGDDD